MAVINGKIVEIEIQEQLSDSAAAKYMIHVKYEKEEFGPIETAALILTNTKPIVKNTLDTGVTVINKVQASG
tara:strand:- start:1241 stop:1456 length:216 start_codon:yes stop_codon:yes gene_type:complete